MGCISSKHSKKQAILEGPWETPPVQKKPSHRASNNDLSLEEYHRHLVALTSTSYGLLKVDVPKTPEDVKKSTSRVRSMNDMYDKLQVLESVESGPKSWNEVSSVLQTLEPSIGRSISMPMQSSNKTGIQETINVADIMEGLEEEASDYSPPSSQDVGLIAVSCDKPQPPPPPPPPRVFTTRREKTFDRATPFQNTIQDLDVSQTNADAVATQKLPRFPSEDVNRISPHETGSRHIMHALGRLNKNPEHLPLFTQKNLTRSSGAQCQSEQSQPVLTENVTVASESNRAVLEDKSVCRDDDPGLNPRACSNITYLTSSRRRLKLTLNLEYENTFFTGTQVSQDACSPAGSSARRSLVDVLTEPDSPLFDPALLASYEKALMELRKEDWSLVNDNDELPDRTRLSKEYDMHLEETPAVQVSEEGQLGFGEPLDDDAMNKNLKIQSYDPLNVFEWNCPPGGEESVVLYTTTLRGIRKTFEDCNYLRETLRSFNVGIDERDVSLHFVFRNELKELMGGPVSVPRIFIKGRYIGGVDVAAKLHEENKLSELLRGLPQELNSGTCDGCGGVRFVPCLECSGSCKIIDHENNVVRCPECNENGLIQCPICS